MTKLYDMNQHNYAINQEFTVSFSSPYETTSEVYVKGFQQILRTLESYWSSLTIDELFRIFIDNKAKQHVIMYLDSQGEIITTIKIEVKKEGL